MRGRAVSDDADSNRFASPFTGVFSHFDALRLQAHDPDVAMWAGTIVPHGARHVPVAVGGAGWTVADARAACLGEAVERYQPYPLPQDRYTTARFSTWALDEPAVDPERWVLFHPEQYTQPDFPFRPFTRDTECRWARFRQAGSGMAVWVPEELAYLYPRSGASHRIGLSISTGLSCGRRADAALLGGVREVVERDALMGAWFGSYRLDEWPLSAVAPLVGKDRLARVLRPNLTYRFFRVASPFSAHVTIVTVEGDEREGYCFSAGAACRETRAASWTKALLESVQGRHYARYLRGVLADGIGRESLPADFSEHAVYYSLYPDRLAETMFARAAEPETQDDATGEEHFSDLAARFGPSRPILFRLMTPLCAAHTDPPWVVVKVVIPGLQPLHGNHAFPFLGGPLWAPRGLDEWRTMPPHPFP